MNLHQTKPAAALAHFCLTILIVILLLAGCDEGEVQPLPAGLPACIPAGQQPVEAQVKHIADGDTITVLIDGQDYRLRYVGINAPEMDSEVQRALAEDAAELNRQLVENQTVNLYLDTSDTDRYDRLLRYVISGETFVNYELVRRGLARAHDYPPDTACSATFEEAESLAREQGLGIWAEQ